MHRPVRFVEHVGEVHPHRGVVRVRIPGPLEVPQRAVGPVVPAVVGGRLEGLGHRVGDEQRHPARPGVLERRREHRPQVVLGRHVRDRVVHEHRVERPPQPHRTHVALDVLALGVEPSAHRQHLRRAVDEREPEVGLQVRGVVAAARTELQDLARLAPGALDEQPAVVLGLLGVLLGRREQRPPLGELAVEPRRLVHGDEPSRAVTRRAGRGSRLRGCRSSAPRWTGCSSSSRSPSCSRSPAATTC